MIVKMKTINEEVKERWQDTKEYQEYSVKTKSYSQEKWQYLASGMNEIFYLISELKNSGLSADALEVQLLIKKLQEFISDNYYQCSDEVFLGLGKMYVEDERFKNNIDKNGIGTAKYVYDAIQIYLKK